MNEERLNMDTRKFLKTFGIGAQREIENAVRDAVKAGRLQGDETLSVRAVLTVDGLLEGHTVAGEIGLK